MRARVLLALCALLLATAKGGCARTAASANELSPPGPEKNTGREPGGAYFYDFRVADKASENKVPDGLYVSDDDFTQTGFALVYWTPDNVKFDAEGMKLIARRQPKGKAPFTSGEVHVSGFYGYGRYEVVMRAAAGLGLDNAFFLHTFSMFGDPHDEIDIEFVGKEPRKAHLNYFKNGKPFGSIWADLNFDATKEIHLYAFEWTPNSLRWYVDDRIVAQKTRPPELQIPFTSQRPIMNLLVGAEGLWDWLGKPEFPDGATMLVTCTSHVPRGGEGKHCSDLPDRAGAPVPANR